MTASDTPDHELLARLDAEIAAETEAIAALRERIRAAEAEIAGSKSERYWDIRSISNMDGVVAGLVAAIVLALFLARVIH